MSQSRLAYYPSLGRLLPALLFFVLPPFASAQNFFPLNDVRPGLHGIGRTIFSGNRIEEFQVEILGVLRNTGPKQVIVLARLSGGPLAQTGILQGMSGSPVYIDGKLLGAVALGFPFSKEPIAGIQPIEEMIHGASLTPEPRPPDPEPQSFTNWAFFRKSAVPTDSAVSTPFGNLHHMLTPVALSGFTPATLQTFAEQFRALGLEAMQGFSPSASAAAPPAPVPTLQPGSMISVGLLTGDMNIAADGTVTYVDGNRVYAFGHRFLDSGTTEMPFAQSDVIALIPNLNTSFKLSTPRNWIGTIVSDRATAIAGEIGRPAHTVPMEIDLVSSATGTHDYHFQVVNDRFLTPFITQTALFSVLDATERSLGRGTLRLSGHIEWAGTLPPLEIRDTFISDSNLLQQAAADAVVPLGFVLGAGFRDIQPRKIIYRIEASESKRQLRLAQAWTSTHDIRPGEPLRITAVLEGENGLRITRSISWTIPKGASLGPLNLTISDGNTLNFPEFAGLNQSSLPTSLDLIRTINAFRDNDALYIRIWRQQPAFTISGPAPSDEISDPPPSVALVLADPSSSASTNAALTMTRGSQLAELSIPTRGYVVTGAKTLQVEVKE
ncbi:MAG TPA: SpoIVB peptidase S55 domain-containing protein [Bryobacteraceae bacterium]|nr:SpoIVB peptidase S55 domain-containing protein [Bryobacteraceae bacterium]